MRYNSNRVEVTVFSTIHQLVQKNFHHGLRNFVLSDITLQIPLPRNSRKLASIESPSASSLARIILKTVLQFHFLVEQLSLALENITLFQKTDISFRRISKLFSLYCRTYKKRNDSTILARKVGLLSLSQKKCSPLHLDYYKLSKRFDGKYLGGILLILEGVSTARSLFTRGFISPLLEEERDRECKLSTKWRSIPLIKLHNTPVHGTTPQEK